MAESLLLTLASAASHNKLGLELLGTDMAALERAAADALIGGDSRTASTELHGGPLKGLLRYSEMVLRGTAITESTDLPGLTPPQVATLLSKYRA